MTGKDSQHLADKVAEATRNGIGQMSAAQLDLGWERLANALDQGRGPSLPVVARTPRWRLGVAAAAALALGIVGYRLVSPRQAAPLRYVVEGAQVVADERVVAGPTDPAKLIFTDRSEVRAAPATRLRVASLDARGARVALADGELDVRVEHRPDTSWRFDAGPFSVWVRGTAFNLAYDAQRGRLAVRMLTGVVEVRGPSADRAITLRAGESIELYAGPRSKPVAAAAATGSALAASEAPVAKRIPEPSRPVPHRRVAVVERPEVAVERPSWSRLIARGEFAAVVEDAERLGLDQVLSSATAADLTSLADAARYTRRDDLARRALLGVRWRFAGTAGAKDAAFFLGRLAEAGHGSAALSWYDTYLRESREGPYASEALGRQLVLLARTDRARARQAAKSYLERFPGGSQAELAKSLVE
jgi:ferric-dicitrate binding protein FerR (iron transport regulator)